MSVNFWTKLPKPIIALAPMAGINDVAFREICAQFGADVLYSEMASATALTKSPKKTLEMLQRHKSKQPYIVQLFGHHPEHFKIAVKVLEKELKPDGIDINFGCPVNKVLRQGAGAVLMKDKKQAREIIKSTVSVANVPVSIKTRAQAGAVNVLDFVDHVKDIDLQAIMIHGRSLSQGFVGEIDYSTIKQVKEKFKGLVLANGNIQSLEQAKKTLALTGADGLGIARGALGSPWIFQDLKYSPVEYDFRAMSKVAIKQTKLACKYKGEDSAIKEMRKHLAWYVQGYPKAREIRQSLVQVKTLSDIKNILENYDSTYRHH